MFLKLPPLFSHRARTKQLISNYEEQCSKFMKGTTVAHFKELFPASATTKKLSAEKKPIIMKLQNSWLERTLEDLDNLVRYNLGVPGSHLHLSTVITGCIAVHWLCPTDVVPELEEAITAAANSLRAEGVQQVSIGDRLVLEPIEGTILLMVA